MSQDLVQLTLGKDQIKGQFAIGSAVILPRHIDGNDIGNRDKIYVVNGNRISVGRPKGTDAYYAVVGKPYNNFCAGI